jgi:ComF family protein
MGLPFLPPFAAALKATAGELFPTEIERALAGEDAQTWRPDRLGSYCPRCGASTGVGGVTALGCAFCVGKSLQWQRMTRLGPYAEPIDQWIRAMKFARQWCWAPWFGRQLAHAVGQPFDHAKVVVCPVPMHWLRRYNRGYNQAQLMAKALAKARRWPTANLLRRTRHTPPQTAVAPSRRHHNVRGSFAIATVDLTNYEIILVDDVKTSGATLGECARLLRHAGARSVHAAVAAVADPSDRAFNAI